MIASYIYILFALILLYTLAYTLGNIVLQLFSKPNSGFSPFYGLFLGVISLVTIHAIFQTKGLSILSGNLLIAAYFLIKNKIKLNTFRSLKIKFNRDYFISLIVLILIFCVQLFTKIDLDVGSITKIDIDYSFYARLATYLNDFGVENNVIEYFLEDKGRPISYHYFDIWIIAWLSKWAAVNSLEAMYFMAFPILYTCLYLGVVHLFRKIKQQLSTAFNKQEYLIAGLIFIISMCGFLYPNSIEFMRMDIWTSTVFGFQKIILIYLVVIIFLDSILVGSIGNIALLSAFLIINNISGSPACIIGTGLYYLYLIIRKKLTIKEAFIYLIPLFIILGFYKTFYIIFGAPSPIELDSDTILGQFQELIWYKTFVNINVKMLIQVVITASPYIILYFLYRQKLQKPIKLVLEFSCVLILAGLLSWAFFWKMHDSVQLFGTVYLPIINIGAVLLVYNIVIVEQKRLKSIILVGLVIILSLLSKVNEPIKGVPLKSNAKTIEEIIKIENPSFAYLRPAETYRSIFDKVEMVFIGELHSLGRYYDPIRAVCLSVHNVKNDNLNEEKLMKINTFYKYVEQLKMKNSFIDLEKARIQFIKEFNIDYILMDKELPLPEYLNMLYRSESSGTIDGYSVYERNAS